jgi:hypothetical protein
MMRRFLSSRSGRRLLVFLSVCAVVSGYLISQSLSASTASVPQLPERHPQLAWAACNRNAHNNKPSTFTPLGDAKAAALVTREPESRRYNATSYTVGGRRYPPVNDYTPTARELRSFRSSKTSLGQPVLQFDPYFRFVDGRDGIPDPSTDDLIQWAAHKWGIPENWLRAEYVQESYWNAFQLGDLANVSAREYSLQPLQARVRGALAAYQSLGIAQVKWIVDGSVGPGTEPLRWESTAFNIDYQAATVRLYYDNPQGARASWGDSSYVPCQQWNSIGGWYEPYPWGNSGQKNYVGEVRQHLADRDWATSYFVNWTPPSFPPGISFDRRPSGRRSG